MTEAEAWEVVEKNLQLLRYFVYDRHSIPVAYREDTLHDLCIRVCIDLQRGYLDRGSLPQITAFAVTKSKQEILRNSGNVAITLPYQKIELWRRILDWQNNNGMSPEVEELLEKQPWLLTRLISITGWGPYSDAYNYEELVKKSTYTELYKGEQRVTPFTLADELLHYDVNTTAENDIRFLLENAYCGILEKAAHKEFTSLSRELFVIAREFELEDVFIELFEEEVGSDSPFCLQTQLTKDEAYLEVNKAIPTPTFSSTGLYLGISRERVRQIYNKAMRRLRDAYFVD